MNRRISRLNFILALILFLTIAFRIVFSIGITSGDSMEPTIHDGDRTLLNKYAYTNKNPERGDVVILYTGIEDEECFIKRVIGEPGDNVSFKDGKVYINGELIDEPYIMDEALTLPDDGIDNITLGNDEVFCMGDNREGSLDSRSIGPVNVDDILGKVYLRFGSDILTDSI